MTESGWLVDQFELNRGYLRGVAYRMLGSLSEADDAVQECWLRLSRAGSEGIENFRGWLTTVVSRICLDMLRSRKSRREEALDAPDGAPATPQAASANPESEALLADSVGFAMLVVLDRLNPAERVAFVLHDLFDVSFADVARTMGRTEESTRQLASRARRRVRGVTRLAETDLAQQRSLVEDFLAALRAGDAGKLVGLLAPEFAVHADATVAHVIPAGIHGAEAWAHEVIKSARGARFARPALIDGSVGVLIAPRGRLFRALLLTINDGKISRIEFLGDPVRLSALEIAALDVAGDQPVH